MADKRELTFSFIGEETVSKASKSAEKALGDLGKRYKKTETETKDLAHSTDELDTASSKATSSLGALSSGFELIGANGAAQGLQSAALATDFFSGVGEGATLVLDKFKGGLSGVKTSLGNFASNIRDAETRTGKFARTLGAATIAIGVAVAASQAASAAFGQKLNPQIEELSLSLAEFGDTGKKSGEAARLLGKDFEHLSYDLGTLGSGFWTKVGNGIAGTIEGFTGLGDVADESLTHAQERLHAIDSAMAQLVQSGKTDEAAAAFQRMAVEAKNSGISIDDLKNGLPEYTAAQQKAARQTQEAANAAKNQVASLQALGTELQAQTDPMFNLIEKQKGLTAAQKDYNDAIKEHGQKSPEAQQALRNMAQAAIAVEIATGSAAGSFDGHLTPAMKATLRSAGFTAGEIKNLETQFKNAKTAGDKFAKNYNADVFVDWHYRTFGKPGTGVNGIGGSTFKGRASGGPIQSGRTYLVGENGPELITAGQDGYVHDANKSAAMMDKIDLNQVDFAKELAAAIRRGKGVLYEDNSWTGMSDRWDEDSQRNSFADRLGVDWQNPGATLKRLEAFINRAQTLTSSYSSGSSSSDSYGGEQTVRIIVEGTGLLEGLRKVIRVGGGNVQQVLGR